MRYTLYDRFTALLVEFFDFIHSIETFYGKD